jgi:hypothetical protein
MDVDYVTTLVVPVLMGIGLAAACGLRAFLPLFVVSLAAHYDLLTLNPSFNWLDSTPAMIALCVAVALEILSDKIPVVDNFLDSAAVYIKPIAAAIITAGLVSQFDPWLATVLGLITGGTTAALVHMGKAGVRVASTAVTAGMGNIFLSITEDIFAFLGSIFAIFAPIAAGILAIFAVVMLYRFIRQRIGRKCAATT